MGTLFRQTPNNGYRFPPKWPLKMGSLAASAAHPRPNNIWVPPPPPPEVYSYMYYMYLQYLATQEQEANPRNFRRNKWNKMVHLLLVAHPCTYQVWWKSTQGFLRFRVHDVKIAYLDHVHWPLVDLTQNRISSSPPGGASLYQVWWKSTQGFLRFCVKEVKIAYI